MTQRDATDGDRPARRQAERSNLHCNPGADCRPSRGRCSLSGPRTPGHAVCRPHGASTQIVEPAKDDVEAMSLMPVSQFGDDRKRQDGSHVLERPSDVPQHRPARWIHLEHPLGLRSLPRGGDPRLTRKQQTPLPTAQR